jgi:hypothetical protein
MAPQQLDKEVALKCEFNRMAGTAAPPCLTDS